MDELSKALNENLAADFPNARLKAMRPRGGLLGAQTDRYGEGGPTLLASIEETHKAITTTLAEVSSLTEQLTGSAVGMLDGQKEVAPSTQGVLPHIHALAAQMQAMASSITAMVHDIRGRL